ncbi:transposase [Desulfitobacterium sp. AusDCA]|uniref:transposase n=1 Tax=Desulfitobacterium sp. AusDCA TaxID=3240383 RepID=UPI003DA6D685
MSKYSFQKLINMLDEIHRGATVTATCHKYHVSTSAFYIWRNKYSSIEASDLKRLKDENTKLAWLIITQAMDIQVLKSAIRKQLKPAFKKTT